MDEKEKKRKRDNKTEKTIHTVIERERHWLWSHGLARPTTRQSITFVVAYIPEHRFIREINNSKEVSSSR